jgi:P-type Mg2+ transporter
MTTSESQFDKPLWTISSDDALNQLGTSRNGLTPAEAQLKLLHYGANLLKPKRRTDTFTLLINQFRSPLVLILIIAALH